MKFSILYLFHSTSLLLFEIKRLDLPATAHASELYQWLHYVPSTQQLTPLTFVSLQSNPPFEVREFRQGSLRFSTIGGTYQPAGTSSVVALRRDFLMELPLQLNEQLRAGSWLPGRTPNPAA